MKSAKQILTLLLIHISLLSMAQGNPFLKKYAGSYYLLAFGVERSNEATEKIALTSDGKWSSTGLPVDVNGAVVSKTPFKKLGTWKATEGLIQISSNEKGTPTVTEFKLDDGLFMSSNAYLEKIFISDPIYIKKYAATYDILQDENEQPTEATTRIILMPDGKCTRVTAQYDNNGVLAKTPGKEPGTWKAGEGTIETSFVEEGEPNQTKYQWKDGVFQSASTILKKSVPRVAPDFYLKKYAGTYQMLVDGQTANSKSDQYFFTADGKCVWTVFATPPVKTPGTWQASEGRIQMSFGEGDFDKGDGPASNFRLTDGVFRSEGVFLKKYVPKAAPKK